MPQQMGELPEPPDPAVVEQLRELEQKKGFQKLQARRAAIMISQYNHILKGLRGQVPGGNLHLVAATLAVGLFTPDNNP